MTGCFQLPVSRLIVAKVARQWGAKINHTNNDKPVASPTHLDLKFDLADFGLLYFHRQTLHK